MTTELNSHLEDLFPQKVWWELHKSNIHSRAGIAKPLITENNATGEKYDVVVIKPGRVMTLNM